MLDVVFLVGGLLLILFGANWLTDGASSLAKRFKIPPIIIGLTIVAFGTSAPELAVSVSSAIQGSADLAIGNVVGSNIFNLLLIVGCTALVAPITISEGTLNIEIPLVILASFVLVILGSDIFLAGALSDSLSRADGLILLCFFIIFLSYTFYVAKKSGRESIDTQGEEIQVMSLLKSSLFILGGLVALVFGGKIFVEGSSDIARALGVSESVIGLTLVAGGTSLPELATSVVASLKKNPEIAIGNVVGSSLFNIFFVLGCTATITPLEIGGITSFDLWTMVISAILLFVVSLCFGKRIIKRSEGILFVLLYVGYVTYLIYNI